MSKAERQVLMDSLDRARIILAGYSSPYPDRQEIKKRDEQQRYIDRLEHKLKIKP